MSRSVGGSGGERVGMVTAHHVVTRTVMVNEGRDDTNDDANSNECQLQLKQLRQPTRKHKRPLNERRRGQATAHSEPVVHIADDSRWHPEHTPD